MRPMLLCLAFLACLPAAAGCGDKQVPTVEYGKLSQSAADLYLDARKAYDQTLVSGVQGAAYAQALRTRVLGNLRAAGDNDPNNPLLKTKEAEILALLGFDDEARRLHEDAVGVEQDWVAGWLGLAELAIKRERPALAEQRLGEAEQALANLQARAGRVLETDQPFVFRLAGIPIFQESTPTYDGPKLTDKQAVAYLIAWLEENENWDAGRDLPKAVTGQMSVEPGGVYKRLRARIAFGYAAVADLRGAPLEQLLAAYDEALRWDPDLYQARLAKAQVLRKLGQYDRADNLTRAYLEKRPKLKNNVALLLESGTNYVNWYLKEPDPVLARAAEERLARVQALDPDFAPVYVEAARLYLHDGARNDDTQTLRVAGEYLDNAHRLLDERDFGDAREAQLRREIERLTAQVADALAGRERA